MLTIGTSPKSPSERRSAAKYCPQGDLVALLSEDAVKLHGCRLVVKAHLLFHNLLDFRRHLRRSARPQASINVASLLEFLHELRYTHPAAFKALFPQQLCDGRRFVAFTVVKKDPLLLGLTFSTLPHCAQTACQLHTSLLLVWLGPDSQSLPYRIPESTEQAA